MPCPSAHARESVTATPRQEGAAACHIERLTVTEFRNYRQARLELPPPDAAQAIILIGPNGAGKTNLLEAISLLSPGRGFRRARLGDIGRIGGSGLWGVAAQLRRGTALVELGTGIERIAPANGEAGERSERRKVRIDGQNTAPARLAEQLSVVWLSPAMDRLFTDGASGRRRFLDRVVYAFDADHARRVAEYERLLRERSRLLRRGGDARWIDVLERSLAETGIAIAAARNEAVARLSPALQTGIEGFPKAAIHIGGTVEEWLAAMPALAAEERFRAALESGRGRDAETGGAGIGPHRSDLIVQVAATGRAASLCSTGEQKALLVSLVLAQAVTVAGERGEAPILLLDEIAAHLDADRRRALFAALPALGFQVWMTGTERGQFDGFGGGSHFVNVSDGILSGMTKKEG